MEGMGGLWRRDLVMTCRDVMPTSTGVAGKSPSAGENFWCLRREGYRVSSLILMFITEKDNLRCE